MFKIFISLIPVASLLLIGYMDKAHNPGYIAYTILGAICAANALAFFKIAMWIHEMMHDDDK